MVFHSHSSNLNNNHSILDWGLSLEGLVTLGALPPLSATLLLEYAPYYIIPKYAFTDEMTCRPKIAQYFV